jgi:hypothetical protein
MQVRSLSASKKLLRRDINLELHQKSPSGVWRDPGRPAPFNSGFAIDL